MPTNTSLAATEGQLFTKTLLIALACMWPLSPRAEQAAQTTSTLSIRVLPVSDPDQRTQLWRQIDKVSKPTEITIAAGQTPAEKVRQLCGSAPEDLLSILLAKNPDANLVASSEVRRLRFIPCPFWYFGEGARQPTIRVTKGEKLDDLLVFYMGAAGGTTVGAVRGLNPGMISVDGQIVKSGTLTLPYITRALHLRLPTAVDENTAAKIAQSVANQLPQSSKQIAVQVGPRGPQLSSGAYALVEESAANVPDPKGSCGGPQTDDSWPYDVDAVRKAFNELSQTLPTGPKVSTVLIADTGLDLSNKILESDPALKSLVWTNPSVMGTLFFKSDPHGASMVTRTGDQEAIAPTPEYEFADHGTQVAGIFLESAKRARLTNSQIAIAKLNNDQKPFTIGLNAIPTAFEYANRIGANVISLSVVIGAPVNGLLDGLKTGRYLVVAAAGNNLGFVDQNNIFPPNVGGEFRGRLLVVGAHTWANDIAEFSNFGNLVDILAPGCSIPIRNAQGELSFASGTSFAVPFVAYAASLLDSIQLPSEQVKTRLLVSGDFDATIALKVKYGVRLDVERAVRLRDDSIMVGSGSSIPKGLYFGDIDPDTQWTCTVGGEDRVFNAQNVYKIIPRYPIGGVSVFKVWTQAPNNTDIVEYVCDRPFDQPLNFKIRGGSDFTTFDDWNTLVDVVPRWLR